MKKYALRCTIDQTRKALELGAPIEIFGDEDITRDLVKMATAEGQLDEVEKELNDSDHATIIGELVYCMPTAEEMIGWLEEQGIKFKIYEKFKNSWHYYVGYRTRREPIKEFDNLKTRQEATIAAIDAALEYLSNNKK